MANISQAEGKFTLLGAEALNKNEILQVLTMMKEELEDIEYCTCLHCNLTDTEPDVSSFISDGYETQFFGAGRWYYEHNIKGLFHCLMYSWNMKKRKVEINNKHINILNLLIDKNIQFQFEFYDYEEGQSPDFVFKEHMIVRPYFDLQENKYSTELIMYDSNQYVATGNRMVQFNYIEDFYTLEEVKNNVNELFDNDSAKEYWLYEEDNVSCFEYGKYVYAPDREMFFLA